MSETVTKKVLVRQLVEKHNFEEDQARVLVNEFFNSIIEVVKTGEELCITGFGSFMVREKNARQGRNPRTGKEYLIDERKVVTFRTSAMLKEKLSHVPSEKEQVSSSEVVSLNQRSLDK